MSSSGPILAATSARPSPFKSHTIIGEYHMPRSIFQPRSLIHSSVPSDLCASILKVSGDLYQYLTHGSIFSPGCLIT